MKKRSGRSGKKENEVGVVGKWSGRSGNDRGGREKVKRMSGRSGEEENEVGEVRKWSGRSGKGEKEVGKFGRI